MKQLIKLTWLDLLRQFWSGANVSLTNFNNQIWSGQSLGQPTLVHVEYDCTVCGHVLITGHSLDSPSLL